MSGNKYTGEVQFEMNGKPHVIVFDWRAIADVKTLLGDVDLQKSLNSVDPMAIADLLVIGLKRKHPDITKAAILDASPPLIKAVKAIDEAIAFAYFGPDGMKDQTGGGQEATGKKTK